MEQPRNLGQALAKLCEPKRGFWVKVRHYRSEGLCLRNGLCHSCACVRVAGEGCLPGSEVCRRRRRVAARHGGSVFFKVRFRGRGTHGCVLLTEIYKMSHKT